jgi:hypothetical protein
LPCSCSLLQTTTLTPANHHTTVLHRIHSLNTTTRRLQYQSIITTPNHHSNTIKMQYALVAASLIGAVVAQGQWGEHSQGGSWGSSDGSWGSATATAAAATASDVMVTKVVTDFTVSRSNQL